MDTYESLEDALRVANDVLAKRLDPNLGCGLIAGIGRKLGSPSFLEQFSLLTHEQEEHEPFGISASACVPEILAACREFIAIKGA